MYQQRNYYIVLYFLLVSLLSSCSSIAWIGYKKPANSDYETIESVPIKVGLQNLNSKEKIALREAIKQVYLIFSSDKFKKEIESKTWLLSCEIENGKKDQLDGKSVYNLLINGFVDFSIHSQKPWNSIAQAQKSKSRIAIKPGRIGAWHYDDLLMKSLLINTLAHEITHIASFKFKDSGHGTVDCPDKELVSYGVGKLVAQLWMSRHWSTNN